MYPLPPPAQPLNLKSPKPHDWAAIPETLSLMIGLLCKEVTGDSDRPCRGDMTASLDELKQASETVKGLGFDSPTRNAVKVIDPYQQS